MKPPRRTEHRARRTQPAGAAASGGASAAPAARAAPAASARAALRRNAGRQRGAALLLAMVVLTLVATLAAGMVWQQWRAVQVEAAERQRAQLAWILGGALDLGRVILRLDGRTPGVDHLGEPWATELQEASLGSLLAQDRNASAEGAPEVYLRGRIRDAQSRYNLRNLVDDEHRVVAAELDALKRLCVNAGQAPELAETIANGLAAAWRPDAAGEAPLAPSSVDELVWLGADAEALKALKPLVDLLPERTPVNLNTASREVLAGVVAGLDAASAERLVQSRQNRPLRNLDDARDFIADAAQRDPKRLSVASRYFEVSGWLRAEGRVVEERMLVRRQGREVTPVARQRRALAPGQG
jgi:general secretion pathway protein K